MCIARRVLPCQLVLLRQAVCVLVSPGVSNASFNTCRNYGCDRLAKLRRRQALSKLDLSWEPGRPKIVAVKLHMVVTGLRCDLYSQGFRTTVVQHITRESNNV